MSSIARERARGTAIVPPAAGRHSASFTVKSPSMSGPPSGATPSSASYPSRTAPRRCSGCSSVRSARRPPCSSAGGAILGRPEGCTRFHAGKNPPTRSMGWYCWGRSSGRWPSSTRRRGRSGSLRPATVGWWAPSPSPPSDARGFGSRCGYRFSAGSGPEPTDFSKIGEDNVQRRLASGRLRLEPRRDNFCFCVL